MAEETIRLSADALISMIVTEAEARELAALPQIESEPGTVEPSDRFRQKMAPLLRKADRRLARRTAFVRLRRIGLALAVILALLFCCLLPVQAVRESVVTTLFSWQDAFTSVLFVSDDPPVEMPAVTLAYIPEGFTCIDSSEDSSSHYYVQYQGTGDAFFMLKVVPIGDRQAVFLDNEHSAYYSLEFDGHQALWVAVSEGHNILLWEDDGLMFLTGGMMDLNQLVKIAQNIQLTAP